MFNGNLRPKKINMLSPSAEKTIDKYFALPFDGVENVRCPYFNCSRKNYRGQIRGLIGKGSPEEIVEEAKILSIQYHHGLFDKEGHCCIHGDDCRAGVPAEAIRHFLIDNDIGIDCSGFAAYVLLAHFKEARHVNIAGKFFFWPRKNFIRRLIAKLRPIENMSVKVFAKNENTDKLFDGRGAVDFHKIIPGDIVIMLETGPRKTRNHILVVTACDGTTVEYVHARAWSIEGKYGHGIARGKISVVKPGGNLLEQTWTELEKTNEHNETFWEARDANVLEIRRIITN
jgi:hypothetical protein